MEYSSWSIDLKLADQSQDQILPILDLEKGAKYYNTMRKGFFTRVVPRNW